MGTRAFGVDRARGFRVTDHAAIRALARECKGETLRHKSPGGEILICLGGSVGAGGEGVTPEGFAGTG